MSEKDGAVSEVDPRVALKAPLWLGVGCLGVFFLLGQVGCGVHKGLQAGAEVTQSDADAYVRQAIHKSNEGVVFYPSKKAEREFDRVRMRELAQGLRQPAAHCFLSRAIAKMEPAIIDGEASYSGVPSGQAKIRARISPDGSVMQTEVLETGFGDEDMENCLRRAIEDLHFPKSRQGFSHHVDVIYWVSLGFHREAGTAPFLLHMRREQVKAAIRAKPCLSGRVERGDYDVEGLNLFDRTGATLASRVTRSGLPKDVSECVATAFKGARIKPESDSFVRPATMSVRFSLLEGGEIVVEDEEWLRLLLLEERAAREERRSALSDGEPSAPADEKPDGFFDRGDAALLGPAPDPAEDPERFTPGEASTPPQDPAAPGTKLKLGPR